MDARLGWIQKQFALSGNDVRAVVVKEPRIVMFGLGPLQVYVASPRERKRERERKGGKREREQSTLQRLVNLFNKELEFTPGQMKTMLLNDPRLFMMGEFYV